MDEHLDKTPSGHEATWRIHNYEGGDVALDPEF